MRKANGQQSNPSPAPVVSLSDLQAQMAQMANAVQLLMANVPEAKAAPAPARVATKPAVSAPSERQLRNVEYEVDSRRGTLAIEIDLSRQGQETARGNESLASAFWVPVGTLADGRTLSLQLQLVAKAPKGGKR